VGVFGLCNGDPLVKTLRDVFGANIVRVPEERIRPVSALAVHDGKCVFRGDLSALLEGAVPPELSPLPAHTSTMAELSGKRSRSVDLDLGLKILEGFLGAFGIPSAGVTTSFKGAKEVSFSFGNVQRLWIDNNLLGRALTGHKVSAQNPAAAIYFGDDPWKLVAVDSVIASSNFTISVDRSSSKDFQLDVPAIEKVVGEAKVGVKVSSTASTQLTFKGREHLTFAFTAVRLYLDADRRIASIPPESNLFMLDTVPPEAELLPSPDRVLLTKDPAMIEWDPE
jgi:hypothetical protein